MDLFNNIQELILKLNNSIKLLSKYGRELSEAEKRFKRDVAECMYQTAQESINVLKLQIRVLSKQLELEWSNNNE